VDLLERPGDEAPRHPWERARARFFGDLLARYGRASGAGGMGPLLDVGAGDGWFATTMATRFPGLEVTCWDPGYDDPAVDRDALARAAGERIRFTAEAPAGRFPLITLLDVLEHVEDDAGFLGALLQERAAPGAWVVVSVPAWPALFTRHDVRLRHHRRYTPASARRLLEGAGLALMASGGLFGSLLPIRAVGKLLERARGVDARTLSAGDLDPPPPLRFAGPRAVGTVLDVALGADAAVSRALGPGHLALPGLSWWAVGRRREQEVTAR